MKRNRFKTEVLPGRTGGPRAVRALDAEVIDAAWAAMRARLPAHPYPDPAHPLGCHRRRASDRACFEGIVWRLGTGCSWADAGRLAGVGATTLRRRADEWAACGVFAAVEAEALAAYDRVVGLDLSEVAVDGSAHKAPCGGPGTGPNPTDRGKRGWKWSIAADAAGIPIGWAADGANRHDLALLAPTLAAVADRALCADIATLHLDRGYDTATARAALARHGITDAIIAHQRRPGEPADPRHARLGLRWPVERTNSWLSNFGQLRRNTDRRPHHRHAQLSLAITLIITIKLLDWAHRWGLPPPG